jgi:ferredoxin
MTKPKGKTPSLLTQSTGKPIPYECRRRTSCNRCKEVISLGEKCFQIPKSNSGFTSPKTYCLNCFGQILGQTKSELLELEKMLNDQIALTR